ncbi:carbonic anhydrase family protein [Lacticaseibacillus sp. GG6-2]
MTLDYQAQADWPNGFGQQQSPIQLTEASTIARTAQTLRVSAPYQMAQVRDDGTTIKLLGTGAMTIGTRQYHCVQAHFHVPVEHVTDAPAVLELHLVHQTSLGQLCVVAILLGEGAANKTLQTVIDHFAAKQTVPATIDLTPLVPKQGFSYHYLGSLTTPPLTEGVEWYVIDAPQLTVSVEQAAWFVGQFAANNRDLQPLAGRTVERFDFKA